MPLDRYEQWESKWKNKKGLDYFSYIGDVFNPEDALILCGLFFPEFVEERGGVFLAGRFSIENFSDWSVQMKGVIPDIERFVNHVHLYDVFSRCDVDIAESVFEKLAEVIGFCWRAALKDKYPTKTFNVIVSSSDQDYGPVVTFFQI